MLGMDGGVMLMASSDVSRRRGAASDGVVAHQFPAGLRVLVVDDDPTCLKILERMLRNCLYEVTTCSRAIMALAMLRERKVVFDLVLSDVHMPDMDGFKLLEHIGLEMDLPVIMMSVDDKKDVVMKGVTHGACDYLIKPIRIEAIKTIWQHVVRKRRNDIKDLEQSGSIEDCERNRKVSDDADYASSANEGSWKSSKRRKEEEDELDERDDSSTLKKPRVVWSVELHQQFVVAVNQLGIDKAVPKKILELMNVPGLTRENVASHLQVFDTFSSSIDDPDSSLIPSLISTVQKYRLYLRRLSRVSQGGLNTLMGPQDASFGHMSSLDLQALAASSPHSLASLQAGGLVARTTAKTSGIGLPYVDQRNPYTSEAPTIRFGAGQQLNGSSTQAHVFHGLPTNMEPKQLPHLHQPIHLPGNMGLQINEAASGFTSMPTVSAGTSSNHLDTVQRSQIMQMTQARSRGQSSNEISGVHPSGAPLSTGQQIIPREIAGQVLGRNVNVRNGRDTAYDPGPQASSAFDFQMNNSAELPGNGFPLITAGVSSLRPTGMFQNGRSFEVKGSRGFVPSYDVFNELQQGKTQDWELQNLDSAYEASRHSKPGFAPAVSNHQGFQSGLKSGQNENSSVVSNPMASLGENQFGNSDSFQQRYNNLPVDSLSRIKTESMSDFGSENMYTKQYDQDDLMSVFLKQQQGTVGSVDNESNFDGYSVDDIHV